MAGMRWPSNSACPNSFPSLRAFTTPDTPMPEVQLLSNGRYHVMISNAGGGYSRWRDLAVTRWGTIKAYFRTHQTALPGVFAVGDIVRGASLVVWAIRDGREAADSVEAYLAQPASVAAE